MSALIRVILAEDDRLAQRAIRTYLGHAEDIELVGVADDGEAAVVLAHDTSPDVAIVDIQMPKLDGIGVINAISGPPLNCKVVCFTALADDATLLRAIDAGASGFLLKSDSPGLILHGVRSAFSGDSLVSPQMVARLLAGGLRRSEPPGDLTDMDRQLLRLIGLGLSNAEISHEVHLSTSTVKTYVSRLLAKLDRPNRAVLATMAHEWGLIEH